jgi:hypothetical protein
MQYLLWASYPPIRKAWQKIRIASSIWNYSSGATHKMKCIVFIYDICGGAVEFSSGFMEARCGIPRQCQRSYTLDVE